MGANFRRPSNLHFYFLILGLFDFIGSFSPARGKPPFLVLPTSKCHCPRSQDCLEVGCYFSSFLLLSFCPSLHSGLVTPMGKQVLTITHMETRKHMETTRRKIKKNPPCNEANLKIPKSIYHRNPMKATSFCAFVTQDLPFLRNEEITHCLHLESCDLIQFDKS